MTNLYNIPNIIHKINFHVKPIFVPSFNFELLIPEVKKIFKCKELMIEENYYISHR